ncbi:T9SS sorting signal type C domain-containing protein [Flavobacterium lacus]|uniref:Uncharacterized protein n=1 Tax=Flavobacterium lacus TaxID=1353778 RepID=A0A328WW76_9FLAO|nr:T9SS sorting signal type C domain-containing protein [Flavobacterium lacus]RAR47548.1 hypothetical protein B0I10_10848 [Flavobacterium lacus]
MKKDNWGFFFPSNKYQIILLIAIFIYPNDTTAQCTNGVQFGSAIAPTNSLPATISTCNYQTEYSPITSIVAGTTYQINSDCGGYVTVRRDSFNGTVVSNGTAPHTFTAPTSGTYYVHYNTNIGCGTATNCCTTTITCISCSAPVGCINNTAFGSSIAPTSNAPTTISTCNFQTEYSTITSIVSGTTYQVNSSCGGYITVRSGTYNGAIVSQGNAPLTFTATSSGTYYIHYNTNSSCGTATNCCTTIITCTSCTAPIGCVNTSSFGSANAPTNATVTTISTCNYQTEYSTISNIINGNTYTAGSSCGGYITVRSGTYNGTVIAQGNAPLTWTATSSGTHFIHYNTNSSCGTATTCCTTTIQCNTCSIPCTSGDGTGTTTLGCPSVLSGGLGLDGADPIPMDCNSVSTCVELEATYLQLGNTTSYTVESIDYAPPYQFNCLQNPVSVNVDDIWSPVINLPFNFCFYGNTYNSCIMGSNGMISFNTAAAGGASGFEFNDNLPSTAGALFANTIYGVYHDIDPSVGGEVAWELITLNTGCRALVAGWNNVPMYLENSILYTGMIVLYEDSNIIEVYIKEKNIDSYSFIYSDAWNYGNAIVGIQNAAATEAVVAPGRNGLGTNWTATNEAWRFVPSGPSITSLQWFEGSGTSGPMLGTTDVIEVCPTITTTYTARVTYTLCSGTTITETDETIVTVIGDKTWNGSIDSDWNKNNNWTPVGIPNNTDCVLIPVTPNDPIISGTNYNGLAGTLRILDNATLTVNSNNSITVTDWVNVQPNGTFDIHDNSSLVQINNTTNVGNIIYRRDTDIRRLDYVYWSSPVSGFNVSNIPAPIAPGPIFTWNTTLANPNGGQGYWVGAAGSTMQPAIGYIMRGPNSFGNTPTTLNGSFIGVPNNGQITTSISRGSDTNTATHYGLNGTEITNFSDNYNLIGNPYPSAIRASQFLFNNNTTIEGNVRLWTHGTLPAAITSPFYDTYTYNYTPGDYFIYNFTGASCCPATGSDLFIGAGQGFFVQMIDGPPASGVVTFNNGLRNPSYDNSLFYRNANQIETQTNLTNLERHRMWFDIINSDGLNDRTLIGYIENATMGRDSFFDANTAVAGNMIIYSFLQEEKLTIQGRGLPFDVNDVVPLGVHIPTSGQYTIALAAIDGLFENQAVYLKDNLTNNIHDIKENPYSFTAQQGTYNNRFEVIYQNETLSNPDFSFENSVRVTSNENVTVHSTIELMESVLVYNVLGQKLAEYNNVNSNQLVLSNLQKNNSTLLLKIKLQNGTTSIEKVIY